MSETGTGGEDVRGGTRERQKEARDAGREAADRADRMAPAPDVVAPSAPDTPPESSREAPPYTILIVEDEEPIAEAIAYIVEEAGYLSLRAPHGKRALELAQGRQLALIITDLMMPLMDGAELIATLRANAARDGQPTPPIILMTAASQRRALAAGADAILRKPFDLDDLEALMLALLGSSATNTPPDAPEASAPASEAPGSKDSATPVPSQEATSTTTDATDTTDATGAASARNETAQNTPRKSRQQAADG